MASYDLTSADARAIRAAANALLASDGQVSDDSERLHKLADDIDPPKCGRLLEAHIDGHACFNTFGSCNLDKNHEGQHNFRIGNTVYYF